MADDPQKQPPLPHPRLCVGEVAREEDLTLFFALFALERRVSALKKQVEELQSELDAFATELENAKRSREFGRAGAQGS
ncbi:hypothetical protein MLD38_013187 [Melastoma candidum]|uniref:Uncharacterized protein n=1 Tax=Melastoma candidum TaxID=119954 RepID=A0ACB9RCY9_9MYRT|nr:hypothetical protein MLD38_013187 [Melastoma candidum]